MKQIPKILKWHLNTPILFAHEICHYIAALLLGLKPTLHRAEVKLQVSRPDWRLYIVALAPAFAGVPLLVLMGLIAKAEQSPYPLLLGIALNALWLTLSFHDFRAVWRGWREGTWK